MTFGRSTTLLTMAVIACGSAGAVAARPGAIADPSRGSVTITASVAGQARLSGDAAGFCPTSNSATRLIAITAEDAHGATRALTADGFVAAPPAGCAAMSTRRIAIATPLPARGAPLTVLIAPE